jgi:hypothetical protein
MNTSTFETIQIIVLLITVAFSLLTIIGLWHQRDELAASIVELTKADSDLKAECEGLQKSDSELKAADALLLLPGSLTPYNPS